MFSWPPEVVFVPKFRGVYQDSKGAWYFKVRTHKDPETGKWVQVTRRGFTSATDASLARERLVVETADAQSSRAPAVPQAARDATAPPAAASAVPSSAMTVNELIAKYLENANAMNSISSKTAFDYELYADRYVAPWIGDTPIDQVTAAAISEWQLTLATRGGTKNGKPLSANTVRLARAALSGAFKYGLSIGLVAANPVLAVPPPKAKKKTPAHWTPDQAREFLSLQEGDRMFPLWAFLLGTGVRIGETVVLRWANVDIDNRLVRINEFATAHGHELRRTSGKSKDATRTVDIDEHLIAVLAGHRETQTAEAAAPGYEATEYVFTKPKGGHYHPQWLSRRLAALSVEAGLPRLTAHGLRHTSATLMLAGGVPPKVAAERLGHADTTLFSNLYSHVTPTMQREAADQIGAALFE